MLLFVCSAPGFCWCMGLMYGLMYDYWLIALLGLQVRFMATKGNRQNLAATTFPVCPVWRAFPRAFPAATPVQGPIGWQMSHGMSTCCKFSRLVACITEGCVLPCMHPHSCRACSPMPVARAAAAPAYAPARAHAHRSEPQRVADCPHTRPCCGRCSLTHLWLVPISLIEHRLLLLSKEVKPPGATVPCRVRPASHAAACLYGVCSHRSDASNTPGPLFCAPPGVSIEYVPGPKIAFVLPRRPFSAGTSPAALHCTRRRNQRNAKRATARCPLYLPLAVDGPRRRRTTPARPSAGAAPHP
jgi:hypothetical protein